MKRNHRRGAKVSPAAAGVIAVVLAVVAAGLSYVVAGRAKGSSSDTTAKTRPVPATIPADCSRPVENDLNRFLAAVPNGSTVLFPAQGCFAQDRTIMVRDRRRLIIDGNGSTFKRITPPNPINPGVRNTGNANWRILRGDTVTLQNMTIRGNYPAPPRGSSGQGQYTDQGVSIWGGVNDSILNMSIYNTDGEFVEADPDIETGKARFGGDYAKAAQSRNIVIDHLHGEHAGRQCVAATGVDGFVLSNSSLDDCQQDGIDIEIDTPGELARNVHLAGNTIGGVHFAAVTVPVLSFPGFEGQVGNIEIQGNTMTKPTDTCIPPIVIGGDQRGAMDGLSVMANNLLTIGDGVVFGNPNIHGVISHNVIAKTTAARGCDNPGLNPPVATPLRLRGSSVTVMDNTATGY